MVRRFSAVRRGLTLIELVVVVAILGVLAAMLLPKFEGLQNAAGHAAAAGSASDLARLIGTYKSASTVYPDKWDSLTDGTNLWTPGNVNTKAKGLHQELSASSGTGGDGDPIIATGKLTISNLNATEVAAFNKVGITTLMNLTSTSSSRPGDMFTTPVTISASTPVAIVNASGGKKIVDHIYRQNLQAGATSGTIPANTKLVVFGVGPQNSLIPNSMLEAPTYGNANATYIYNRLLAVFEVATSSSGSVKVTFKGILGTDGDLLDDMSVNMQNATL